MITSTSGNNFPAAAAISAVPGEQNNYGDYTKTVALVGHKFAVGTVKLRDLSTEAEYSVRYQGTTIMSKMALGTGVLRPEAMIEIQHR